MIVDDRSTTVQVQANMGSFRDRDRDFYLKAGQPTVNAAARQLPRLGPLRDCADGRA